MKLFAIIFGAILTAAAVIAGVITVSADAKEREDKTLKMIASSRELVESYTRVVVLTSESRRETPMFEARGGMIDTVKRNGEYYAQYGMKSEKLKDGLRRLKWDYEWLVKTIREQRPDKAKYADELEREVAVAFKDY